MTEQVVVFVTHEMESFCFTYIPGADRFRDKDGEDYGDALNALMMEG